MIKDEGAPVGLTTTVLIGNQIQDDGQFRKPSGKSFPENFDNAVKMTSLVSSNEANELRNFRPPKAVVDWKVPDVGFGGDDFIVAQENEQTEFVP